MNLELIEGTLLPSEFKRLQQHLERGEVLYRVTTGEVMLTVTEVNGIISASFAREEHQEISHYDITEAYKEDELSVLRKLVMTAYCQHCKLTVDPDLEISIYDDESVEFEQFSRDIAAAIPESNFEEDLVHDEGDDGQASGIHYFILEEETNNCKSYCFIELGVRMPSYCDDNYDAAVSLFVMPKLDGPTRSKMVEERRKLYIGRYLFDITRLFTDFAEETLSLMGEYLSAAKMLTVSEALAGRVDEWWYLATTDALAKACPNLVEMAIETDCEYDDAGGYFNYLSQLTFRSADSEYRYNFDADGFGADEDLLDENGNFGGEEYKKLEGILGEGFANSESEVFGLLETLGHMMMRRNRHSEYIRHLDKGVAA